MTDDDQRAVQNNAIETAVNAINAASQKMQALAGECFEISKQSFEHATKTMEKLRGARGMDEIMTIQANYMKEAFENAGRHACKFGELISGLPAEFTKNYQDAWLQAVNATVQTMQTSSRTAASGAESVAQTAAHTAKRAAQEFEHRESA